MEDCTWLLNELADVTSRYLLPRLGSFYHGIGCAQSLTLASGPITPGSHVSGSVYEGLLHTIVFVQSTKLIYNTQKLLIFLEYTTGSLPSSVQLSLTLSVSCDFHKKLSTFFH